MNADSNIDPAVPAPASRDRFWRLIIGIVSVVAVATVLYLIYGPRPDALDGRLDVSRLPHLNAALNATSALLLLLGFAFIRRREIERHKRAVLAAFGSSGAFLVSYLVYHANKAGPKAYEGGFGWFYYPMLISHILLAAIIVPLALWTLYRGWVWADAPGNVAKHRRIARVTLPLWLYVSLTGVLVWAMLYL
jgi:putative membrane protein